MEIVGLQDGNGSTSVYFLPTVAGSVSSYFELTRSLGRGHAVYGIQCADRDQTGRFKEYASIREMAIAIEGEVLAHHREGPICLIGYSFAAVLALEVAQQLARHGKLVPLVIMIDRIPPLPLFTPLFRVRHFIRNIGAWTARVAFRIVSDSKYWLNYRNALVQKMQGRHVFEDDSWYQRLTNEHQDYVKSNLANLRKYRFEGEYRGKIVVVCQHHSSDRGAHPLRLPQLPDYSGDGAGDAVIQIVHVPGDHVTMLEPPNVEHVASAVRLALNECDLGFQDGKAKAAAAARVTVARKPALHRASGPG